MQDINNGYVFNRQGRTALDIKTEADSLQLVTDEGKIVALSFLRYGKDTPFPTVKGPEYCFCSNHMFLFDYLCISLDTTADDTVCLTTSSPPPAA